MRDLYGLSFKIPLLIATIVITSTGTSAAPLSSTDLAPSAVLDRAMTRTLTTPPPLTPSTNSANTTHALSPSTPPSPSTPSPPQPPTTLTTTQIGDSPPHLALTDKGLKFSASGFVLLPSATRWATMSTGSRAGVVITWMLVGFFSLVALGWLLVLGLKCWLVFRD